MGIAVSPQIHPQVADFIEKPRKMLINGKWVNSISGKTFPTYNPATGEILAQVAEGDRDDIEQAVKAARRAFDQGPWPRLTASERGRLIWKLADLLESHTEEFAYLESLDNGKPLTIARAADVPLAVDLFRYTAGAAVAAHPHVDKVAFTGSTEVGKLIVHAAAGNLKKVSLELGGKSPNIVYKDADLDSAIPGAASAIFFNHGQCCCAGSRLYVEKPIFDRFVEGVAEHAKKIKVGSGLDPQTEMGPLVSEEQLSRVCGYLEAGFSEGATAMAGGHKKAGSGYFVEPTVLVNTREDMKVVQDEIFGPAVAAMS